MPKGTPWRWLFKNSNSTIPVHQLTRIAACLKACNGRRRVAIDGGAYVGSWSLHLAKHYERVLAFEPVAGNFECLQMNAQHLHNVELHQAALSDGVYAMARVAPRKVKAFTHKVHHVVEDSAEFSSVKIDNLNLANLDLLKLDIEGFEYEALMGGRETILANRPIVMIEEGADTKCRARKLLISWGMRPVMQFKRDFMYVWSNGKK